MARMNFKTTPKAEPHAPEQEEVLQALFAPPRLTSEVDEDDARSRGWYESSWMLRTGLDVHEIEELDTVPMVLDSPFSGRDDDF
jgi:hypothetical protein